MEEFFSTEHISVFIPIIVNTLTTVYIAFRVNGYNKVLENHKMELQKDFESHKYIMNLCQSIDNRFITLIAECLNEEAKNDSICAPEEEEDNHLLQKVVQLERFLTTYKIRYRSNPQVKRLTGLTYSISEQYLSGDLVHFEYEKTPYSRIEYKQKKELIGLLEEILGMFLPELKMK